MHVGFIGTGSMGSTLIRAFISSNALLPVQMIAHNRTPFKTASLKAQYPDLHVAESNADVVKQSNIVFLCVKPLEYKQMLEQITPYLAPEHLLVTITSPIHLSDLESKVPCPVIRVIPSITNAASSGLTLVECGKRVTDKWKRYILALLSQISAPIEIEENFLRIASDISSCGPAFLAYILQEMIQSAQDKTGISYEAAVHLTTQMIIGFGELLKKGIFTLPQLQEKVCVPGGITGEGIQILQQYIPGVFYQVFERTHSKFFEDRVEVRRHL